MERGIITMKIGFDNQKYLKMQSEHIRERISQFGDKLYLEFGGKLLRRIFRMAAAHQGRILLVQRLLYTVIISRIIIPSE